MRKQGSPLELDFSFTLPLEAPITIKNTKVWVHTGLDIKQALDPKDKDYIEVIPTELTNSFLNTLKELGFRLKAAENEKKPLSIPGNMPFVQEFEFVPTGGEFKSKLDELECIFIPRSKDQLDIIMEIDRRPRGLSGLFSEALDMDESKIKLSISQDQVQNLTENTRKTILRFCA